MPDSLEVSKKDRKKLHYLIVSVLGLVTAVGPHFVMQPDAEIFRKLTVQEEQIKDIRKQLGDCQTIQKFLLDERAAAQEQREKEKAVVAPNTVRRSNR